MPRRLVAGLLALVMLTLLGCSQQPAPSKEAPKAEAPKAAAPTAAPAKAAPASPAAPAGKPFQGQTLKVAFWGGTFQKLFHDAMGKPFEEATGAKIEYVVGNPGDQLPKMIAARNQEPPFDLVGLDDGTQALAAARGLIEKFDPARVPNSAKVYPEAFTVKGYAPGFIFIQVGVGYLTEKFKELGISNPTSWDVLWDPRLKGRVAIPDITTSMGPFTLVGVSRLEGGDERNIDPGLNRLAKIDLNHVFVSSTDLEARLLAKDVWAAAWIDGRIGTINSKQKDFMKFVHPKMGNFTGTIGIDSLSVVTGTKKRDMAEALINQALDVKSQVMLAETFFYSPTRPEATQELQKNGKIQDYMVVNPAEAKNRLVPDWGYINTVYEQWVEKWNRTMKK